MSQEYYQRLWNEAQNDLKKNLAADAKLQKAGPTREPEKAKWLVGHLFVRYVQIVNKLDQCYDQLIHPQKREVVGRLLDLSLGRLLELKDEMVRLELDDYCFFDDVLVELKLTQQDLQIRVPTYFWRDREKAVAHRRQLIQAVFDEAEREKFKEEYLKGVQEEDREGVWQKFLMEEEQQRLEKEKLEEQQRKMQTGGLVEKDSVEILKRKLKEPPKEDKKAIIEAISLIQRHERARQGRILAMLESRRRATRGQVSEKIPDDVAERAAKAIQRHWRRHRKRRKMLVVAQKLTEMMDMTPRSFRDKSKYERLENVAKLRRKMQDKNQQEYEEALVKVKEKVTKMYSIPMEEDIVDEIIGWFQWYFKEGGYLPDYPPEKPIIPTGDVLGIPKKLGPEFANKLFPKPKEVGPKVKATVAAKVSPLGIALAGISAIGGSALVVAGHWIGPNDFARCQMELEKRKGGKGGGEKKEKMTKEQIQEMKRKAKELEKKLLAAEEAQGFRLRSSNYTVPLNKADKDYRVVWMDRDESKNPDQKYIYEFVKEDKCYELSTEVRVLVDEMMALELELLKDALERDKNPKKKRKKKKPKKPKNKKKKKGKKDPTGDRTVDDLFLELFQNGIIRDYEPAYIKDYLGERSFGALDMRKRLVDWPPSTGDVRDLIVQTCILPLGSRRVHQLGPLVRSVCLLGTENSGKEFLARAICTETASVMFDLTPENVAGKYPGKDGLKMLKHLLEKMTRILQPSVIFVNGAEKTFYKKVPKEEKALEPKRLAKLISKFPKTIKPEDQVLVLGVSSQPWLAQKRKFLKTFERTIQVPQMDYGSYVKLWQDLLTSYHSVPGDFDVSCLARVSYGFSVKDIMETVENVLTTQRISRSRFRPYTQLEFLDELLRKNAIDPKITNKSLKFYSKLDLPKKRAKRLNELRQSLEKAKKGG